MGRKLIFYCLLLFDMLEYLRGVIGMKKKFDNQAIGQRIKNIRLEQKLTQEEFGKLFTPPAARPVVVNWEKGNYKPQKERLNKIAEMGNTTVEYLLTGVDPISGKTDRYYSEVPKKKFILKKSGIYGKLSNSPKLSTEKEKTFDDTLKNLYELRLALYKKNDPYKINIPGVKEVLYFFDENNNRLELDDYINHKVDIIVKLVQELRPNDEE